MGKVKVHYIEVVFDKEDDDDEEGIGQDSSEPSKTTEKLKLQGIPKGLTISTLSGVPKYYTFNIRGIMKG
jgi:hypothetical protein